MGRGGRAGGVGACWWRALSLAQTSQPPTAAARRGCQLFEGRSGTVIWEWGRGGGHHALRQPPSMSWLPRLSRVWAVLRWGCGHRTTGPFACDGRHSILSERREHELVDPDEGRQAPGMQEPQLQYSLELLPQGQVACNQRPTGVGIQAWSEPERSNKRGFRKIGIRSCTFPQERHHQGVRETNLCAIGQAGGNSFDHGEQRERGRRRHAPRSHEQLRAPCCFGDRCGPFRNSGVLGSGAS